MVNQVKEIMSGFVEYDNHGYVSMLRAGVRPELVEQVIAIVAEGPITVADLGKRIGFGGQFTKNLVHYIVMIGRPEAVENVRVPLPGPSRPGGPTRSYLDALRAWSARKLEQGREAAVVRPTEPEPVVAADEPTEALAPRFASSLQKGVSEKRVALIIDIVSEGPIHMNELAERLGSSRVFARNACNFIVSTGRGDAIRNVWVWPPGGHNPGKPRERVCYVDSLEEYRRKMAGGPGKRTGWCRECGLPGQLEHVVSLVCTSCQETRFTGKKRSSVEHLVDDHRWQRILAREHGERGCCLICGSSRAKERDGRYCSWRHDVIMLNPAELEELLDRYGLEQPRYDVWGNRVS